MKHLNNVMHVEDRRTKSNSAACRRFQKPSTIVTTMSSYTHHSTRTRTSTETSHQVTLPQEEVSIPQTLPQEEVSIPQSKCSAMEEVSIPQGNNPI